MKLLVHEYPALLATFWRYASGTFFTFLFWLLVGRPWITRSMLPVHLLRGAVIACSAFAFFWALSVLPLVEVVTISFIGPLLVPPIAALMLGERMQRGSVLAGFVGFLGVLVAAGLAPGDHSLRQWPGVAAVVFSACCYAFSIVLIRQRASRDGAAILSLLGTLVPALCLLPFAFGLGDSAGLLPGREAVFPAVATGFLGAVALQFLAMAYGRLQAQLLVPFEYSALLWAALYGWLFFAEPVPLRVPLGAAIIAGACLYQVRMASRGLRFTPPSE